MLKVYSFHTCLYIFFLACNFFLNVSNVQSHSAFSPKPASSLIHNVANTMGSLVLELP